MTQICQFIFSGSFVNWDPHSTATRSHKRHYGSITSQSHFVQVHSFSIAQCKGASEAKYTIYCLKTTPDFFLAAKRRQNPLPVSQKSTAFMAFGFLRCCAWGSPLRLSPSYMSQSQAQKKEMCNLLNHCAETQLSSYSATSHGESSESKVRHASFFSDIIHCRSSSSPSSDPTFYHLRGPLERKIEFLQRGPLCALKPFF